MESTKELVKSNSKGDAKSCFVFYSCFTSNRSAKYAINFGDEKISIVKTNTKVFYKDIIKNLIKEWPGGSNLMLKRNSMVPRDRFIIPSGYNYKYHKVLSFIAIEDAGSTEADIPYLYH